ncbi:hypothetical protein [Dactylosporangium sp. NPDC050588]|uniref:hypothetical protein n=1 Tax=Dactylosporangium sp. NPDC050588 TaxID=3157211 RepID=UPI0033C538FA
MRRSAPPTDGADVVVTQHSTSTAAAAADVLAGGGGVGKTQLAAWFAHHAIRQQTVDLVMWVPAGTEERVLGPQHSNTIAATAALRAWTTSE